MQPLPSLLAPTGAVLFAAGRPPRVDAPGPAMRAPAPAASGTEAKHRLKLHVRSLSDTDLAKIATFLRIGRERLGCDWATVLEGEHHVLMLGSAEARSVQGSPGRPFATLRLVDGGGDHPAAVGTLLRPLQYEDFLDALREVEQHVLRKAAAAPPMPQAQPAVSVPAPMQRIPAVGPRLMPGTRFRLRRWPPIELLQRDRHCQRLAAFLSARHLELHELARLSNVDEARCVEFLHALAAAGLLDTASATPPAESRPVSRVAAAPRTPRSAVAPRPEAGLFDKIRRGLGLTWRR